MSSYSVFIPRVFTNIGEERITSIFHSLSIGEVNRVDLIRKTGKNGDNYNMAFVHFNHLYDSPSAECFKRDVEDPEKKAKLIYDEPWFWLVLPFEEKEKPVQTLDNSLSFNDQSFVPQQMPQGMWMMTAEAGWQWCWQPQMNQMGYPIAPMMSAPMMSAPALSVPTMIPPQVLYGNRNANQRQHPRRRINVPKNQSRLGAAAPPKKEEPVNQREDLEEGEEDDSIGF
jgi:hypothetical protein|tara:strand:+ start:720 stop:1400 length:681 start_codon:yes stop_codon:yes gene_type:complete